MCGISGYVGFRKAKPILIEGLKNLEYRGYDSSGFFIPPDTIVKSTGDVASLEKKSTRDLLGTIGIAHTRWATHGHPSDKNAHPHSDCRGRVWLVHNGIVENYKELKERLIKQGHVFVSETDSEVVAHLIEEEIKRGSKFVEAFRSALKKVKGSYALAVIDIQNPESIIVARLGSPLVLGLNGKENFIASDPSAFLKYTQKVLYLNDGEMAEVKKDSYVVSTLSGKKINRKTEVIKWEIEKLQKGGYAHFMLKEIEETPRVLQEGLRGRLDLKANKVLLPELEKVKHKLIRAKQIILVGCGSAYYAGLTGKYLLEELTNFSVEVAIASEFRYANRILSKDAVVVAISQSGETADTLASIRKAKSAGLLTLGILNTVGSTIAREVDVPLYSYAGSEIGVASTKAFVSQVQFLILLSLFLGDLKDVLRFNQKSILEELKRIPSKINQVLKDKDKVEYLAEKYKNYSNFLFIARKYSLPVAYEGALKLKEISYIHAEGYGAGEMKHGPLAMIDEFFPTLAIVPKDSVYEKVISNLEEIKARQGKILAITSKGNSKIVQLATDVIYIPNTHELLSPLLSVIPLQLFAYFVGTSKGYNVDRPRNLAKSVTVE